MWDAQFVRDVCLLLNVIELNGIASWDENEIWQRCCLFPEIVTQ